MPVEESTPDDTLCQMSLWDVLYVKQLREVPVLWVIVKAFTIPNVPAVWADANVSLSDVVVQAGRDLCVCVRGGGGGREDGERSRLHYVARRPTFRRI